MISGWISDFQHQPSSFLRILPHLNTSDIAGLNLVRRVTPITWMIDHNPQVPDNAIIEIREVSGSGRSVFARTNLKAGTHILTTSTSLSPIAHVILRQYRREVCAQCFAYDRGTNWKIRIPQTAQSFCSQVCMELWKNEHDDLHVEALRAVEIFIQRYCRRDEDRMELDGEDSLTWEKASEVGSAIVAARSSFAPSKADRKLLASYASGQVEPEILYFFLSGCFMIAASGSERLSSLLTLENNPQVYTTASLEAHIRAYLQLLILLPMSLLPHLRADVCHELVSRACHNAFSIRPSRDGEYSGEFLGYGVWPEASFFNHWCVPNIAKERRGRGWSFHTSRDVEAGEELCITYLGGDEKDLDVRGRRKRLRDEWGFKCSCRGCKEEADE